MNQELLTAFLRNTEKEDDKKLPQEEMEGVKQLFAVWCEAEED